MKKILVIGLLSILSLVSIVVYQAHAFYDGKLHVVFCDVGQGDAIFIRTPDRKHILIDGGPDTSVLSCLSSHMPFWVRDIDLMLLTHPHADHLIGMHFVLDRYNVRHFAVEGLSNNTRIYQDLLATIKEKDIPLTTVWAGDSWDAGVKLSIAAPTSEFIERTSPQGKIGESGEFASIIAQLSYGSFSALFTGDSQSVALSEVAENLEGPVSVLQVPHHGSATGLRQDILMKLAPQLAVISVGEKNRYHHPTPLTLSFLKEQGIRMLRTDKDGDVEIVSDGKMWEVN